MSSSSPALAEAQVAVIVLAVARERAADGKALLAEPMAQGTVLTTTLRHVRASGLPLTMVADAVWRAELLREGVALNELVTLAPEQAALGLAIAAGVTNRPNVAGWLVLPADMPAVAPDTLRRLAQAVQEAHEAPMVYPEHRGQRGQPMGFAGELCADLLRLTDDDSVRRLLARFPTQPVPVPDAGVLVRVRQRAALATAQRLQEIETSP
ncbi:MAG: NTP transferase domain-containing protein [Proteobacteria bacterium]|nr:NTP transferase domain-containing protein [Pseudomonadota bacterium]